MSRHSDRSRPAVCPLCGGTAARHLVTKRGCEVVRCAACTLVFVWPQPTAEELDVLYSGGSYHAAVDEAERHRYFARRFRQIEALAPRRGRLLDVGCSNGFLLDVARAEGWDAVGIEVNRNAVEAARARGLDVRQGELDERMFDEASFDVVTLFDLIEHARDLRATLAACRRVLQPGGLLVVTTPDIGGLVPRVTYGLFAKTLGAWDHPTPPGHLVQFSRRTLLQALENTGFGVARVRSEHIPVAYSVGKLENSIMDVLAGRHQAKPQPAQGAGIGSSAASGKATRSPLRRLARLAVRGVCWGVIGLAGAVARATGRGDSMLVVARRPASQAPSAG